MWKNGKCDVTWSLPPLPQSQTVTLSQTPSLLWSVTYLMDGPWDVWVEGERLGMNVWRMVCTLNGQCSGICGAASFREERLTLAERGKMDVLKINDDDDDDEPLTICDIIIIILLIISMWRELFSFGQSVLAIPAWGGRRHNLTGIIKKRASAGFDQAPESSQPQSFNYKPSRDEDASLAAAVTAKIEDGNLHAAIRLLCSDEKMAIDSQSNLEKLQEKHPPAAVDRRPVSRPDPALSLQVTAGDVLKCLRSFPAGSSAGPDGLRPNHLLDRVNCKESGDALLFALTSFTNCILAGLCPSAVIPVFFEGRLITLQKKAGGIRPIAIGYTLRRMVAKCASTFAITKSENLFAPLQVGVGVPKGCEAAVHATRCFVTSMPSGYMMAKVDFPYAFNSLRHFGNHISICTWNLPALPLCIPRAYGSFLWRSYRTFRGRMPTGWSPRPSPILSDNSATSLFFIEWIGGWIIIIIIIIIIINSFETPPYHNVVTEAPCASDIHMPFQIKRFSTVF